MRQLNSFKDSDNALRLVYDRRFGGHCSGELEKRSEKFHKFPDLLSAQILKGQHPNIDIEIFQDNS